MVDLSSGRWVGGIYYLSVVAQSEGNARRSIERIRQGWHDKGVPLKDKSGKMKLKKKVIPVVQYTAVFRFERQKPKTSVEVE